MSIKTRLPKINQIANSARVIFDNSRHNGKIVYRVDSLADGRPLQVTTEVFKNGILQAKVEMYDFAHKNHKNDKGNHPVDFHPLTVNYQGLGCLKARAKASGKVLSICKSKAAADRLLRFGGELIKISNLGNGIVWGTLR